MINRFRYLMQNHPAIRIFILSLCSAFLRLLGVFIHSYDNIIFFTSFHGDNYDDSPKVLYDVIINDNRFADFRKIWAVKDTRLFSIGGAETVRMFSLKYFVVMLKAKVWVSNCNTENSLHYKRAETMHLNTWHAIAGIKTVGNGQRDRTDYDMSSVDLFTLCRESDTSIYVNNFRISMNTHALVGRPLDDALFKSISKSEIDRIKTSYGIDHGKKVITYVPTFRESEFIRRIDRPIDIAKWKSELSDEYCIILRYHYWSREWNGIEYDDFIFNGNSFASINDLFKITDILISDYSSTFFDFSILERPMVCFAYDYDDYKRTRGMDIDVRTQLGIPCIENEDDLLSFIKALDVATEVERAKAFKTRFIETDGRATEFCVEKIYEYLQTGKLNIEAVAVKEK